MIEMNTLKLEINNLLHLIEIFVSKEDSINTEYLIARLLNIYFESRIDMDCEIHIKAVHNMINKLKTFNNPDCQTIEDDITNLMSLLEQLAFEQSCPV